MERGETSRQIAKQAALPRVIRDIVSADRDIFCKNQRNRIWGKQVEQSLSSLAEFCNRHAWKYPVVPCNAGGKPAVVVPGKKVLVGDDGWLRNTRTHRVPPSQFHYIDLGG